MPRPNKGLDHVDGLQGDPETKWRLKLLLATLTGEMLVQEVCEELDLGPTQFANLRRQMLQAALDGLTPREGGRPRKQVVVSADDLQALQARNQELERQLAEMRARVELALLPFLGHLGHGKRARKKRPDPEPGSGA